MFTLNSILFSIFFGIFAFCEIIRRILYWPFKAVCGILYLMTKLIPEPKADPNPHLSEHCGNAIGHGICKVIDALFPQPELECEKWARKNGYKKEN